MVDSIGGAVKGGYGNAILYAGALGLMLSDILPTPADSIYFTLQQKNKAKLNAKEITPKQYWTRDAINYYTLNPIWWGLVLGAMYITKGTYTDKAKIGLGIVAGGVVIAVLNRNIKKDEELLNNK